MVAGRGVGVLEADGRGRHLVVALGTGAGLVGALRRRGGVRRVLLRVVPGHGETGPSEPEPAVARGRCGAGTHMAGVPGV